MMTELSVIMPFVNEWPQVIWTVRNLADELMERVDFEIITVNNYVEKEIRKPEDKAGKHLLTISRGNKWLKALEYREKLSHWNAKNHAVQNSSGEFLFFCDAHCAVSRDALYRAFKLYQYSHKDLHGTLHLPLTYQILEWHKLIYKLVVDEKIGKVHYSFSSYKEDEHPYEVPCMSTCGMMITRKMYDELGGWPPALGIYGGGENFINFASATLGFKKWIMPGGPLYHHGDRRGYAWNGTDFIRNRMIANFMFGGRDWLDRIANNAKGNPKVLFRIRDEILSGCKEQHDMLKAKQKMTIERWLGQWLNLKL